MHDYVFPGGGELNFELGTDAARSFDHHPITGVSVTWLT